MYAKWSHAVRAAALGALILAGVLGGPISGSAWDGLPIPVTVDAFDIKYTFEQSPPSDPKHILIGYYSNRIELLLAGKNVFMLRGFERPTVDGFCCVKSATLGKIGYRLGAAVCPAGENSPLTLAASYRSPDTRPDFSGWRGTGICNANFDFGGVSVVQAGKPDFRNGDVGSQFSFGGVLGDANSLLRQFGRFDGGVRGKDRIDDGDNESDDASDREPNLPPCEVFLPLSGCGTLDSSVSSKLLGFQVILLPLIACVFAVPGSLGLIFVFDDRYRNRKRLGAFLAGTCLPIFGFLLSWGFYAHPFWFLGYGSVAG